MNESDAIEIEKGIGSEVAQFVYRVPKKNHNAMMLGSRILMATS
jgi:hypothetical protein